MQQECLTYGLRYQNARTKLQTLQQQTDALRVKLTGFKTKKANAQTRIQALRTKKQNHKARIQKITGRIQNLKAKRVEAQAAGNAERVAQLTAKIQKAKTNRQTVKANLATTQGQINKVKTRIQNLTAKIQSTQQQIQANQSKIPQVQANLQKFQQKLQQAQAAQAGLNQALAVAKQQVAAVQPKVVQVRTRVANLQAKVQSKKAQLAQIVAKIQAANQRIKSAQTAIQTHKEKIANIQTKLQNKKQKIQALRTQIQNKQQKLANRRAARPGIEQALAQARTAVQQAQAAVVAKRTQVAKISDRLKKVRERLQSRRQDLNGLQNNRTNHRNELSKFQTRLGELQTRAGRMRRRMANNQNKLSNLQSSLNGSQRSLATAQTDRSNRETELDRAQRRRNRMEVADGDARNRLRQVNAFVQQARRVMNHYASAHGNSDGVQEGRKYGRLDGEEHGRSVGARGGFSAGTAEGKRRDYNQGYAVGTDRGTMEGRAAAVTQAEKDGLRVGTANGRSAGLVVAFQMGKEEGLAEGAANGSDTVAYGRGRTRGEEDGLNRAHREAQVQDPVGYQETEAKHRNAPLKKVTLATEFAGLQGEQSENGRDEFYRPRHSGGEFPHPVVFRSYMRFYNSSYRSTLDSTYQNEYDSTYSAYYSQLFEDRRQQALAMDYPGDRARGDSESYAKFYRNTYESVYASSYPVRYQHYYDIAFAIAEVDTAEHERGFGIGNAIASEQKGLTEGRAHGYATNLGPERDQAYARGAARADSKYHDGAVLEVVARSIALVDANQDSVFMPGERMVTQLVIKNFGYKQKEGLQTQTSVRGRGVGVANPTIAVPTIPAQSEATILGVGVAQVFGNATPSSAFALRFLLVNNDRSRLVDRQFTGEVQFPSSLAVTKFDGVLVPGVEQHLKLRVRNRSSKVQDLQVSVDVDDNLVRLPVPSKQTGELRPGASVLLDFTLTGRAGSAATAQIGFRVEQDGLTFAQPKVIEAALMHRHRFDPNSIGLLLSANFSMGGGLQMFQNIPMLDTWDLRPMVDNVVSSVDQLMPYIEKAVYVMMDEEFALDQRTLSSLRQFVHQGGSVVFLGPYVRESGVLDALGSELGIRDARERRGQKRRGQISANGERFFTGWSIKMSGSFSELMVNSNRNDVVMRLSDGRSVVGVESHVNEFTAQPFGRYIVLAVSPNAIAVQTLLQLTEQVAVAVQNFERKMHNAVLEVGAFDLLFDELIEEMHDEDRNTAVEWYDDYTKSTKIHKMLMKFLRISKSSDVGKNFIQQYPVMIEAIATMRDKRDRRELGYLVSRTRVGFDTTWARRYCQANWNAWDLCREFNRGGGDR